MIEGKTMFGVAAVGASVIVGYGLYKYVQGRQSARKVKEAVDQMVKRVFFMIHVYLEWLSPNALLESGKQTCFGPISS